MLSYTTATCLVAMRLDEAPNLKRIGAPDEFLMVDFDDLGDMSYVPKNLAMTKQALACMGRSPAALTSGLTVVPVPNSALNPTTATDHQLGAYGQSLLYELYSPVAHKLKRLRLHDLADVPPMPGDGLVLARTLYQLDRLDITAEHPSMYTMMLCEVLSMNLLPNLAEVHLVGIGEELIMAAHLWPVCMAAAARNKPLRLHVSWADKKESEVLMSLVNQHLPGFVPMLSLV